MTTLSSPSSLLSNEEMEENKPVDLKRALYSTAQRRRLVMSIDLKPALYSIAQGRRLVMRSFRHEPQKRRLTMESTHSGRKEVLEERTGRSWDDLFPFPTSTILSSAHIFPGHFPISWIIMKRSST